MPIIEEARTHTNSSSGASAREESSEHFSWIYHFFFLPSSECTDCRLPGDECTIAQHCCVIGTRVLIGRHFHFCRKHFHCRFCRKLPIPSAFYGKPCCLQCFRGESFQVEQRLNVNNRGFEVCNFCACRLTKLESRLKRILKQIPLECSSTLSRKRSRTPLKLYYALLPVQKFKVV